MLVFICGRDAVRSARRDVGITDAYLLEIPATAERIRMSCPDTFVERIVGSKEGAQHYLVKGSC